MIENRKGARTTKEIPIEVLTQLNKGLIESVNLTEWLAVDQAQLAKEILPTLCHSLCMENINKLKSTSTAQLTKSIGNSIRDYIHQTQDKDLVGLMRNHRSDTIRCWTAYTIGQDKFETIADRLDAIKPIAADSHFGVREMVWMAVREEIINNLDEALKHLESWTQSEDANVRRFATESTRPNGVWCSHITALKGNPQSALPILEALKSDKSRYVQDSVANWLNDASKSQPEFVMQLCLRWEKESPTAETQYIVKRALRTIAKK